MSRPPLPWEDGIEKGIDDFDYIRDRKDVQECRCPWPCDEPPMPLYHWRGDRHWTIYQIASKLLGEFLNRRHDCDGCGYGDSLRRLVCVEGRWLCWRCKGN